MNDPSCLLSLVLTRGTRWPYRLMGPSAALGYSCSVLHRRFSILILSQESLGFWLVITNLSLVKQVGVGDVEILQACMSRGEPVFFKPYIPNSQATIIL